MRLLEPGNLDRVISELRAAEYVAIDTEFHAERRYIPQLYLVQIQIPGSGVYGIDAMVPGLLDSIAPHLLGCTWILHAGRQDLRILNQVIGGVPDRVIDVQIADGLLRASFPRGFDDLLAHWLGRPMGRSETLSDWSRRPLTEDQLAYAARDVEPLPELWNRLRQTLEHTGRVTLAEAAFSHAREQSISAVNPDNVWRRLSAASHLSASSLHVLKELTTWREREAEQANVPARSILSDGVLTDLARKQPGSVETLFRNRRFPKSIAKKYGSKLIQMVQTAGGRPEDQAPPIPRNNTPQARRLDFLRLVTDTYCVEQGFSRKLVAPDVALQRIACGLEISESLPPWSAAIMTPILDRATRGQVALSAHPQTCEDLTLAPISKPAKND